MVNAVKDRMEKDSFQNSGLQNTRLQKAVLETDVFIVGGGPAGLATAIAARQKGLTVSVADCASPPLDKACGEGLMPDAIASLARLGVAIGSGDGHPFVGIRFIECSQSAEAAFPGGIGMGVRRTALHRKLIERATQAGVSLIWGARVERSESGEFLVGDSVIRSRWIIGADGHKSRVRQWAGLDQFRRQEVRYGSRGRFRVKPWTDRVEVYWGPGRQIVMTPVGADEVCLALISGEPRLRLREALGRFPELKTRLGNAPATTTERGALSAMSRLKKVSNGRFALVGDASGSVDVITGEGMRLAFRQAACLAEALAKNDLDLYESAHRRIARLPMIMSQLMLTMGRHRTLRHGVLRLFKARPSIFSAFLAAHVGSLAAHFGLGTAIKPGREFPDAAAEAAPRKALYGPQ